MSKKNICEPDLDKVLLMIAKEREGRDDFNIEKYDVKLEEMIFELEARIDSEKPDEIISEINSYLFEEESFEVGNSTLITEVLDKKEGSCQGLASLYLALTEKLDLPFYGVRVPEHFIVRWENEELKRNVDPIDEGVEYSDLKYKDKYDISEESIENEVYLKNLSKEHVIASVLCNRGLEYRKEGDIDKAINDFEKAIDLDPKHAEAYNNVGVAYSMKGHYENAISCYEKSLFLNPKDAGVYINRGNLHRNRGDIDKALSDYQRVFELDEENIEAYNNRGIAYIKKGDIDKAINDFEKAIDLDPENPHVHQNLEAASQDGR